MKCKLKNNGSIFVITMSHGGMSLVEIVVAMAIVAVVITAVIPQIRAIRMGWATARENVELVENSQALMDHITFNLMKARRIMAVSDACDINGFIEFMDSKDDIMRYQIGNNNYVQYGEVGDLADLAGPVSVLQFTCYDPYDLNTPITDVDYIRSVEVLATLPNPNEQGRDQTLTVWAYLRTNYLSAEIVLSEEYEFDTFKCQTPSLAKIDDEHYLCAFGGGWNRGTAVVLIPRYISDAWQITKGATFTFDWSLGRIPELCQIDTTHYLCAYRGQSSDGYAVVLNVNTFTWAVTKNATYEFANNTFLPIPEDATGDALTSYRPALAKIDDTHYLCAYMGAGYDGYAVVLTVNPSTYAISAGTPFEFDAIEGQGPALVKIVNDQYLCAYTGAGEVGRVIVLTVDTSTWTITKESSSIFAPVRGNRPDLAKIDDEHYLCAYSGENSHGWIVVLNVDLGDWGISKNTPYEFDPVRGQVPELQKIDAINYVCSYEGECVDPNLGELSDSAETVLLSVSPINWSVRTSMPSIKYSYEGDAPDIAVIDGSTFFSAYDGYYWHGWATVLEVDLQIKP